MRRHNNKNYVRKELMNCGVTVFNDSNPSQMMEKHSFARPGIAVAVIKNN
jgi:hypothetical protein